ncbi:hypothetical protein V7128_01105 [Neobacillus vireti]|uniref:hypothetical protein n=1 Tax=Neobacillus vireti TaxID=220686 RepID=UPI002FFD8F74
MKNYKIHTEGRDIKEVIKVGRTFRIDVNGKMNKVKELRGFVYCTQLGHTLENGTKVIYVTILREDEKQQEKKSTVKIPANKKRFIIATDGQLGMESGEYDEEKDQWTVVWYIWDKVEEDIVEGYAYSGKGARTMAKRDADKLNIDYLNK